MSSRLALLHESLTHKKKKIKESQGRHPQLHTQLEASLLYTGHCLKARQKAKNEMRCSLLVEHLPDIVQKRKEGTKEGRQASREPGHHQVS